MLFLSKNVGILDRLLRVCAGLLLIVLAAKGLIGFWGYIGVVPLLTFEAEPNLGNLIVHVHPTTSEPAPGPGLARETFTQSPLVKKDAGNGHQLMSWGQLQRELCLQP